MTSPHRLRRTARMTTYVKCCLYFQDHSSRIFRQKVGLLLQPWSNSYFRSIFHVLGILKIAFPLPPFSLESSISTKDFAPGWGRVLLGALGALAAVLPLGPLCAELAPLLCGGRRLAQRLPMTAVATQASHDAALDCKGISAKIFRGNSSTPKSTVH